METNLKKRGYGSLLTWKLGTGGGPRGNGQLGCRELTSLSTELSRAQRPRAGTSLGTISKPFHRGKPQDGGGVAEPGGRAPNVPDPHSDRGPCRLPGERRAARSLRTRSRSCCHRCEVLGTGEKELRRPLSSRAKKAQVDVAHGWATP